VLGLAACGGSGSDGAAAPASASSAPAPTTAAPAEADTCADAQPEIEAGAKATGFVTSVEVGSCDSATVTTSLGTSPDDVQSALGVCSIAANEAEQHGVAKVSIVSSDGTELVAGTGAGDCAAV
jgi:hypothetical protein